MSVWHGLFLCVRWKKIEFPNLEGISRIFAAAFLDRLQGQIFANAQPDRILHFVIREIILTMQVDLVAQVPASVLVGFKFGCLLS